MLDDLTNSSNLDLSNFDGGEEHSNMSAKRRAKKTAKVEKHHENKMAKVENRHVKKVNRAVVHATRKANRHDAKAIRKGGAPAGTPQGNQELINVNDEVATDQEQLSEDASAPQEESPSAAPQAEIAQEETEMPEDATQAEEMPTGLEMAEEEAEFLGIKESADGKILGMSKPLFYGITGFVALGLAYVAYVKLIKK